MALIGHKWDDTDDGRWWWYEISTKIIGAIQRDLVLTNEGLTLRPLDEREDPTMLYLRLRNQGERNLTS